MVGPPVQPRNQNKPAFAKRISRKGSLPCSTCSTLPKLLTSLAEPHSAETLGEKERLPRVPFSVSLVAGETDL